MAQWSTNSLKPALMLSTCCSRPRHCWGRSEQSGNCTGAWQREAVGVPRYLQPPALTQRERRSVKGSSKLLKTLREQVSPPPMSEPQTQ